MGVGTHASASCGGYSKHGCVRLNPHAYVLGFDGALYAAAKFFDKVKEKPQLGCYGLVLDCNKHELHFFLLDGRIRR